MTGQARGAHTDRHSTLPLSDERARLGDRVVFQSGRGVVSWTAYPPEKKTQVQVENTPSMRAAMTMLWEPYFG